MFDNLVSRAVAFTLAIAVALVTVGSATVMHLIVQPSVQFTGDALIVNTAFSSSIIDSRGLAGSFVPSGLSCGIDTRGALTPWCEIADYADATPTGLVPLSVAGSPGVTGNEQ